MELLANVGTGLKKGFRSTVEFFREGVKELKKVRWPNRKELISYSSVVIFTVLFVTVYFVIVDYGISSLLHLIGLGN